MVLAFGGVLARNWRGGLRWWVEMVEMVEMVVDE
jgi:hypothetical protein